MSPAQEVDDIKSNKPTHQLEPKIRKVLHKDASQLPYPSILDGVSLEIEQRFALSQQIDPNGVLLNDQTDSNSLLVQAKLRMLTEKLNVLMELYQLKSLQLQNLYRGTPSLNIESKQEIETLEKEEAKENNFMAYLSSQESRDFDSVYGQNTDHSQDNIECFEMLGTGNSDSLNSSFQKNLFMTTKYNQIPLQGRYNSQEDNLNSVF